MNKESLKEKHSAFNQLRIKMKRTPSSRSFMSFVRRINNKTAVQVTHDLLKELQSYKQTGEIQELTDSIKSVKTFLSAFMIIGNKDDVFSVHGEEERLLHDAATKMITTFEKVCEAIYSHEDSHLHSLLDTFHTEHELYSAHFNSWKDGDLNRLLIVYRHSYFELRLTKQTVLKQAEEENRDLLPDEELWSTELDKQMDKIKEILIKLGGEEQLELLNQDEPEIINLDTIIDEVAHEQYWVQFKEQLQANDRTRLYELLTEVNTRLKALIPNRTDIHAELDDIIDTEFVKHQVENSVYTPQQFIALATYIVKQVKRFGIPADDDAVNDWFEQYKGSITEESTYPDLLPPFFNRILCQLDRIEDVTESIKNNNEE